MVTFTSKSLSNFSRSAKSACKVGRIYHTYEIDEYLQKNPTGVATPRGRGLSYNDSCFNTDGNILDLSKLTRFLDWDPKTYHISAESGVSFNDILNLNLSPAVMPGTVHATLGGAIAHDIHGKNNPKMGTFGHHVQSFTLKTHNDTLNVSKTEHSELFHATIAGLGLTGTIAEVTLALEKRPPYVTINESSPKDFAALCQSMKNHESFDFQASWLNLLTPEKSRLIQANYSEKTKQHDISRLIKLPPSPCNLIHPFTMKIFNRLYHRKKLNNEQSLSLKAFNNPLDNLLNWNTFYGPKGLLQFQALFPEETIEHHLHDVIRIINKANALPALSVLKYFTNAGNGLLSFVRPGFTLAIDFPNHQKSLKAIANLNTYTLGVKGNIYLAKDTLLTQNQFQQCYPNHEKFRAILHQLDFPVQSDLGKRLGLI